MMKIIEVKNLCKTYNGLKAIDNISFTIEKGEVFGMLGPNGAGKTTTVECIEGLREADSGQIFVMGKEINGNLSSIKQKIGVQLQTTALFPYLTVNEILSLFAKFFKKSEEVPLLIETVGLTDKRNNQAKELSGGQQQRLSIALALVNKPEILFLDEPTTGLDPQSRRNIWEVILDYKSKGKTVFLTTHYMEEAATLCGRVAIIDQGKIVALNSPQGLIQENFDQTQIEKDKPTLEDVFLKLTGRKIRD